MAAKTTAAMAVLFLAAATASSSDVGANPVQKVLQLLGDLEAKVKSEGAASQQNHVEFTAWCKERSSTLNNEIKTGKAEVADLQAAVSRASSMIERHATEIDEATTSIASNEAELKSAIEIRGNERDAFAAEESDLVDTIGALERAVGILEKEAMKGPAMLQQCESAGNVVAALKVLVDSSLLGERDAKTLTALVQGASQGSGSPDGSVYDNHSGSILSTLQELLEKARSQLDDARAKEKAATQNFQNLRQSLEDSVKYANQDLASAKANRLNQEQNKATATEDLAMASKNVAENTQALNTLELECKKRTEEFEEETKSRSEELKALGDAKKIVADMTGGAQSIQYSASSFLQQAQSTLKTSADLANFEVVQFVRRLARQQNSEALTQLGRRIASSLQASALTGDNPFGKVKGLISELIERLQNESEADAAEKAYCDKEIAYNSDKEQRKTAEFDRLTTWIDNMEARSAELKEQVADLQKALAALAATQKEMNGLRSEEHEQFVKDKAEMEKGVEGIKTALKILRDYYAQSGAAHSAAKGSASSIIGVLEVAEADFAKTLAEVESMESERQAEYEQGTKDNELEKAEKEQDVKYKTVEMSKIAKALRETDSDHKSAKAELEVILDYKAKLVERCAPKAETYAQRTARRAAEISGLEEALTILENEAALVQRHSTVRRHHA
eukprot:NODE_74_length_2226_cov_210.863657.p2 GENE.NODE_74_length_2226_cov_210.863657~~NODE_74_length_2226_cov_210.863657.p2  ORF type:complete len:697 (-),score=365.67 NODE_74_length_2226_cov_210.863657:136-2175(-)